jgi:ribosome maturation factor RimP
MSLPGTILNETSELQQQLEARISELDPAIELIALERPRGRSLRLFIDHPEGVDIALCERVTDQLRDLLAEFSLEVSSPGQDRRLTKPEHFERFVGREVCVKTAEQINGQRSFTGTLAAVDGPELELEVAEGRVTIPLAGIRRSNLVPETAAEPS